MSDENNSQDLETLRCTEALEDEVVRALDNLPIIERLYFARNLVDVNGGSRHLYDCVPQLVVARRVIDDVINVLERHPAAAKLRTPDP